MKPKYLGTGYCRYCEKDVDVFKVDEGIGFYEYWGSRGYHHDWRACCAICGEEMDYTPDDAPFYYSHAKYPRI